MVPKGSQGTLHEAVIDYIATHLENGFADVISYKHTEKFTCVVRDYSSSLGSGVEFFAISLLKRVDDKGRIASRRRMACWNPSCLAQVLEYQGEVCVRPGSLLT